MQGPQFSDKFPGQPWPSLANPGPPWPTLANPGQPWPSLAIPGPPWPSLAHPGQPWPCVLDAPPFPLAAPSREPLPALLWPLGLSFSFSAPLWVHVGSFHAFRALLDCFFDPFSFTAGLSEHTPTPEKRAPVYTGTQIQHNHKVALRWSLEAARPPLWAALGRSLEALRPLVDALGAPHGGRGRLLGSSRGTSKTLSGRFFALLGHTWARPGSPDASRERFLIIVWSTWELHSGRYGKGIRQLVQGFGMQYSTPLCGLLHPLAPSLPHVLW